MSRNLSGPAAGLRVSSRRGSDAKAPPASMTIAHLGIDFGSVGSRLVLSWRNDKGDLKYLVVRCKDPRFHHSLKREHAFEFPSDCTVDGKSRLVDNDVPIDQWTSGKYLLYLLSNPTEELRKEYPVIKALSAGFLGDVQGARQALLRHFGALRGRVCEVCTVGGLQLSSITATVPNQWAADLDLIESYTSVLSEVFDREVMICLEAQAIAHSILGAGDGLSQEIGYQPDVVVTLDLGGHSASTSIFAVAGAGTGGQKFSYYDTQINKGAGGGCEDFLRKATNWIAGKVRERITELVGPGNVYSDEEMEHLTASTKEQFLKEFAGRMKTCATNDEFFADFIFRYHLSLKGTVEPQSCRNRVLGTMLDEFWHQSMENVHRMIKEQLRDAERQIGIQGRYGGVTTLPLLLVSGGTAGAPPIRSFLDTQCKRFGFGQYLRFANDLDFVDSITTTSIAKGASIVGATEDTAQAFMDRGPAQIAVQMRQAGCKQWDREAQIVLNGRGKTTLKDTPELFVQKGDSLKLICRPIPAHVMRTSVRQESGLVNVHLGFYDLTDLISNISKYGFLQIRARCEGQDDEMVLVVGKRWSGGNQAGSPWEVARIPLFFDPSFNCVLAGRKGEQWNEGRLPEFQLEP